MSIRPRFAEAILAGAKTVELRRQRPRFEPGTIVIVYASAPCQRVVARFESGEVISAAPGALWKLVSGQAGVTRAEFDAYFAGCDIAHAIPVRDAQPVQP